MQIFTKCCASPSSSCWEIQSGQIGSAIPIAKLPARLKISANIWKDRQTLPKIDLSEKTNLNRDWMDVFSNTSSDDYTTPRDQSWWESTQILDTLTHRPEAHGNKTRPYADGRQRGYHKLSGLMKNQAHSAHALIKNVEVIDSVLL